MNFLYRFSQKNRSVLYYIGGIKIGYVDLFSEPADAQRCVTSICFTGRSTSENLKANDFFLTIHLRFMFFSNLSRTIPSVSTVFH